MNNADKVAIKNWEQFHVSHMKALSVDDTETGVQKSLRIKRLEADHEVWFNYYFPNYCTSEPAQFHKDAALRNLNNQRWFEVRAWSRELSKSTRSMMENIYKVLVKKTRKNVLMVSNSQDNAERLLMPFKLVYEHNKRIINDYGIQVTNGSWTGSEFIIRSGCAYRALGAGQSPRGTRFENLRVDEMIIDDIDTDEECRNEKIVNDKFKWIQEALIPTISISGNYSIIVNGNIIAKHCCVTLLSKLAHHVDVVNIRDKDGNSTWPQKNSEADIDAILSLISYASAQKEYFNNPLSVGSVFKEMAYKPARPLSEYRYLVCYTDPSFKDSKKNDFKATVLVGRFRDEFHVIKAFVDQTSTAKMIEWHYDIDAFVKNRVPVYYYMEANFMQDTLLREFYTEGAKRKRVIPIKGDERKKLDKFTRIESLLEPLNRNGKLFLNSAEAENKHMQRLEEQFVALEPGSKAHDDAPDAVEGAVFIINSKAAAHGAKLEVSNPYKKSVKKY